MSYVTYTTEALVCGSVNRSSADRSFLLFTREAGMLYAEARSVREERSRQRFALQDFSRVHVSIVKGKQTWRVGSVIPEINYYFTAVDRDARGSVTLVYRQLRRFVTGEMSDTALFDFVTTQLGILSKACRHRDVKDMMFTYQLLEKLGYINAENITLSQHGNEGDVDDETRERIQRAIATAVAHSHL